MAIAELWEVLQADPENTHQFFSGASERQIKAAARTLGIWFPISFVRWLARTGGARVFGDELILGVGPDTPESLDLIKTVASFRGKTPPLPDDLIPFAVYEDGAYCFVSRGKPRAGEQDIVFWHLDGTLEPPSHESFDEWLFELTESCRGEAAGADPHQVASADAVLGTD